MKYEIIKGSEKDFEGAPEWAVLVYKSTVRCFVGSHGEWKNEDSTCIYNNFERHAGISFGEKLIAERRPITEPVVNQQLTTEWDGVGLPPVGSKVMTKSGEGIIDYVGSGVIVYSNNDGQWSVRCDSLDYSLSAIRTPEDVARDEAIKAMREALGHAAGLIEVSNIYRAIAAGKIPGVKLDMKGE